MRIIKSVFLDSVSCGNHRASACADCPQGKGADWCNGDCQWVNEQCQNGGGSHREKRSKWNCFRTHSF